MKNRFKYSENIERYLSHDMAYAEQRSFEKQIASNSSLAAELELTRNIDEALRRDDLIDLRLKLVYARQENSKMKSDIPLVKFRQKKFWYAAASFLILASVGSILLLNIARKDTNEDLFRKYYSSENIIDVTRTGDANIVEAIIKFQEKDYQSSASLFGQILQKDTLNFAGWFFYGISCIETQQFAKAETAFNKIISNDENLYVEHAEWYLGLCYLKSNQPNKATVQSKLIASEPENFHRNDARHLLEKLSR
jgi:hypothetical protein